MIYGQRSCRLVTLFSNGFGNCFTSFQFIPEGINLVKNDDQTFLSTSTQRFDILLPHFKIGFCNSGVCGEDKHHALGIR